MAWQKAKLLAVEVYRATESFPRTEIYGLTTQMRRAAVSIPSNIAEGQGRLTPGEFRHFLGQARGSLLELQTQIEIACDLGYLTAECAARLDEQAAEVVRITNGLCESLIRNTPPTRPARNLKLETRNSQ
ncbi:MAG TPA: four helix bundle protein [Clostridia bacterium]|nr:four helix bundle protein [Clostridia bacterium]